LHLTKAEARNCPRKTRTSVGRVGSDGILRPTKEQEVKALECLFPETWTGGTIRNPEASATYIRQHRQQLPQEQALLRAGGSAEVILYPWPPARLPGGLELVTDFFDTQQRGRGARLAGRRLVAHGASSGLRGVRAEMCAWAPEQGHAVVFSFA
jgi:hypothetical protein